MPQARCVTSLVGSDVDELIMMSYDMICDTLYQLSYHMTPSPPDQIDAMETRMSALNSLLHTKSASSSSHLQPSANKHHRRPSIKKLVRKIAKGRHSKSKGPIQVVEHGSVMKGMQQLKDGQVSGVTIIN